VQRVDTGVLNERRPKARFRARQYLAAALAERSLFFLRNYTHTTGQDSP